MRAKQTPINQMYHSQQGFTLLELLLAIGVFGLIILGFAQLTRDYIDDKQAYAAAEHMKYIHNGAYDEVMDNFSSYLNAVGVAEVIPFATLRANDRIPANITQTNVYGRSVEAVVVTRSVVPPVVEIVCITTGDPVPEARVISAAQYLSGYGGLWSAIDRDTGAGNTTNQVIGTYGMWSTDRTPITNAIVGAGGSITAPAADTGAHLATYNFVNFDNELGDYLYRVAVPASSEANTMRVNIDMTNNSLRGVDNLNVNGGLTINDLADFRGYARVATDVNIAGAMTATGTVTAPNGPAGIGMDMRTSQAPLDISNNLTSGSINMPGVASGRINATTAEIQDLDSNTVTADSINLTNLIATGNTSILATSMEANEVDLTQGTGSGRMEVGELTGGTTVTISGAVDTQSISGAGNFTAADARAEGTLNINRAEFRPGAEFTCNNGC